VRIRDLRDLLPAQWKALRKAAPADATTSCTS
jgi:hypothetical protein